jgi:hypothetical protein
LTLGIAQRACGERGPARASSGHERVEVGRASERSKVAACMRASACQRGSCACCGISEGKLLWQRRRKKREDLVYGGGGGGEREYAGLRCSRYCTTSACGCPLSLPSLLLLLLHPQSASQPAPASSFGRRREIARQCALARRRAVCVREQRTRTQTYLTDARCNAMQCCCCCSDALLSARPAVSYAAMRTCLSPLDAGVLGLL